MNEMEWNGMESNGMKWNGMESNGIERNGITPQHYAATLKQLKKTLLICV
jgi:hypothetical protein